MKTGEAKKKRRKTEERRKAPDFSGVWKKGLSYFQSAARLFWDAVRWKGMFWTALACAGCVWLLSALYYAGKLEDNFPAGWLWLFSFPALAAAFLDRKKRAARTIPDMGGESALTPQKKTNLSKLLLLLSVVYFLSHLYNYPLAPWNNYGLFDDAAWDIFVAQEKCFTGGAFEIIFWNPDIGMISRELLFHYYISILFRLFGYNLFVFNMALILLGYITVLFTALLAAELFQSTLSGFAAGLLLNFLPIEFTQVFMGHRYAICGPLIMISAFLIQRAFRRNSVPYAAAGGVFAGFAMESAIMGKQYLWALCGAAILHAAVYAFGRWKRTEPRDGWTPKQVFPLFLGILLGYAVAAAPLYAYIVTHGDLYNIRQASLTAEFFRQLRAEGFPALWRRIQRLWETLFAPHSWTRQFSYDFPILPWYLAIPAVTGAFAMFLRKHYVSVLMIAIPIAGNIVSESYDFRLLIAAPFLALCIVDALRLAAAYLLKSDAAPRAAFPIRETAILLTVLVLMAAPTSYLRRLAHDANAHMFNHRSTAASRYIQDVVVGSEAPDFMMKWDEFHRPNHNTDYDVFAATYASYAHVHAYLQPYNSRYILRLFGDFPYIGQENAQLRTQMARTLSEYEITERDLVLVFEYDQKIADILAELDQIAPQPAHRDSAVIDGNLITMLCYRIPSQNLPAFVQQARTVFGS